MWAWSVTRLISTPCIRTFLLLPLIALQLWWALDLFKGRSSSLPGRRLLAWGILSGVTMLIRPTTIIVMIAFWAVLFFRGNWKAFGKIATGDGHDDGFCLAGLNTAVNHQKLCRSWNKKGWLKDLSCLSIWAWQIWGTTKKIWKRAY